MVGSPDANQPGMREEGNTKTVFEGRVAKTFIHKYKLFIIYQLI
jgi:hypothetical protein